jgi:hypothetical protein
MGIYNVMFIGGLILAILFLALTVVLFFVLDIPAAFGSVTGSTQKKALDDIRSGKTKDNGQHKRRKSQSGLIRARDVKASSSTGSLMTGFTDIQKKAEGSGSVKSESGSMKTADTTSSRLKASTNNADRDASSDLVRQAELAAQRARNAEIEADANDFTPEHLTEQDIPRPDVKEQISEAETTALTEETVEQEDKKNTKIHINPKTGKRYELDSEDTEILTYSDMAGKDSEDDTTALGAKIPGEEEETDVLRAGVSDNDLYDEDLLDSEDSTDLLTSGLQTDLDEVKPIEQEKVDMPEEDTDVLVSNHKPQEEPESYIFSNKKATPEDETDRLQGEDLSDVEVAETETVEEVADRARPKPSFSITDMLRHAMEEGKNVPDSEEDDEDYDEDEEDVTGVLTSDGIESGNLSQADVHGTLDENLTSVLKADMMPDAEEKKPTIADVRIKVLYDATIVHTDESL